MAKITVADLINKLNEMPKDLPVLIAGDDEGNSFRIIDENYIELQTYNGATNSFDLEVGPEELTDDMRKNGWSEQDIYEHKCVLLG